MSCGIEANPPVLQQIPFLQNIIKIFQIRIFFCIGGQKPWFIFCPGIGIPRAIKNKTTPYIQYCKHLKKQHHFYWFLKSSCPHSYKINTCCHFSTSIIGTVPFNEIQTGRSEEHTSELQSHWYISYAVFCLKKKNQDWTISGIKPLCLHAMWQQCAKHCILGH